MDEDNDIPYKRRRPLLERFWEKVDRRPGDDSCWLWTASTGGEMGYGRFWVDGKRENAHRVSWEIANGSIPEGLFVCHRCDTPRCVRPDHLFLGTPEENTHDMMRKGRKATGPRCGRAKLNWDQVEEIRQLSAQGATTVALGLRYGVHNETIRRIANGTGWR